jgi:mono/diheme cytochrome c family protein
VLEAEEQRSGDAEAGYRALVNEGYVSCGIPLEAYELAFGAEALEADRLEGRTGLNARLAYDWTAVEKPSGVTVVTNNCLGCHASRVNGELVVGLGSIAADFTGDQTSSLTLIRQVLKDPAALAEFEKFAGRISALAPFVRTETIGANSADNIAPVLYAHRDRETLEWHDDPLMDLPETPVVPLDVPPWWRMQKKHAMFYTGSGRGDHARIMMSASSLCVDDIEQATAIDAYFPDIYAFIQNIEPPRYPFAVDETAARKGQRVFEATCSRCHGTYGDSESYPNLVVDLDVIGTDPVLATSSSYLVGPYIDWFNESFWGERSRLEPNAGYVAPPLDGVWATAPYLHNGSVPTIAELLNSKTRPGYWTRDRGDSRSYDESALGFSYEELDHGQAGLAEEEQAPIYDTTLEGYGNGGHTFGDVLTESERTSVLEYLKTL